MLDRVLNTIIQAHDGIRTQADLNFNRLFRCQKMTGSIDVRLERYSLFRNFCQPRQRKDLKSAAVGQNRPPPVHKSVKTVKLIDDLAARPEIEMICIAENDLSSGHQKLFWSQRFNRCLGAHRHKNRRIDPATGSPNDPGSGAGGPGFGNNLKFKHFLASGLWLLASGLWLGQ